MCILTWDQAGAQAQPRVAKVHRQVGYQALESISRGFYRPSSSEIRLIRLSVPSPREGDAACFPGTTATEKLEEDLGDQYFAARFPGAAYEAAPRRGRGARKLPMSWAWLKRSPNRPSGERVESRAVEE